jgi:hypothetical protein
LLAVRNKHDYNQVNLGGCGVKKQTVFCAKNGVDSATRNLGLFIFPAILFCWVFVLMGAAKADIPSSVAPGVIERNLERPPEPKSTDRILVDRPSVVGSPDDAGSVRFVLSSVEMSGSSVYSDHDLSGLYEDLLGKEITLEAVYALANAVTQKYAGDGYALSIGYVPAQEVVDGRVRVGIAEGYIDGIEYQGEKYPKGLLEGYASRVLNSKPLTTADLERFLLLANDIPGISVESTFTRSDGPSGSTQLVLKVSQDSYAGALGLSNRGWVRVKDLRTWKQIHHLDLVSNSHLITFKPGTHAKWLIPESVSSNLSGGMERQWGCVPAYRKQNLGPCCWRNWSFFRKERQAHYLSIIPLFGHVIVMSLAVWNCRLRISPAKF